MSTFNARSFQNPRNVNLKGQGVGRGGILRFEGINASNPLPSTSNGLYINSSNQLIYAAQGSLTVIGQAGGPGAIPTWEAIFALDSTFNVAGTTWTVNNSTGNNDVLTVTNTGAGSGSLIQITNAGSGADIRGDSGTWSVAKTGVATFAGVVITGTSSAFSSSGAAVWTLLDNNASALSFDASGTTGLLVFDTRNSAERITSTATAFVMSAGQASITNASNTVSTLLVTNNTATTFGADANSSGVAVIRSTSLTTGSLLQLQLTEATLNGGFYLTCRDVTGSANVFTVGEDGAAVIAGAGGSTMFTITAGDLVFSDGSIALTDADNAATFTVTNNTATSASVVVLAGSGVFTGTTTTSWMTITPSGLTTGTALYIAAAAATTSVGVVDIAVAGLTTGSALRITAATANFTTGGKLIELTSTAATAGNLLTATTTGAYTGTGMVLITAGAMTTGVTLSIVSTTGLTSGSLIRATSSTAGAIATNGAISFIASGAFTSTSNMGFVNVGAVATAAGTIMSITGGALTTGVGLYIADTATGITSGSLLRATTGTTGAVATNGVISLRATGAYTSTSNAGLLDVAASATTAGTIVNVTGNALTTGVALNVSGTGVYTGTGFITVTQSGATTGVVMQITTAGITTGSALAITTAALTTGQSLLITDSSADTGAHGAIFAKVTNTAAVAAAPLKTSNVAVNNSKFTKIMASTDGTKTVTIWMSQDATTPNGTLTGTAGDICLNGPSSRIFYCTGTTNWTASNA